MARPSSGSPNSSTSFCSINSAVAAALAAQDDSLALLHLQFGQQCSQAAGQAFERMCEWLGPTHQLACSIGDWGQLCDSPIVHADKDIAVVQTGAFELQVAISDIRLLKSDRGK